MQYVLLHTAGPTDHSHPARLPATMLLPLTLPPSSLSAPGGGFGSHGCGAVAHGFFSSPSVLSVLLLLLLLWCCFTQLDGQFDSNVILQIKNGPMDFQIREPLHPLLGALKHTNVMMAVQAAQEYTGQQIHAVNL